MRNKTTTIILIIILSVFTVLITCGFIYLMSADINFDFVINLNDKNTILIDSYKTNINEINKIDLSLSSTDLLIKGSDNDNIIIEYYSNSQKNAKIEKTNDTISINEDDYDLKCIGICNNSRKIIIYIPNNYNKELKISTKSGDIKSEIDILNEKTIITTISGDININKINSIKIVTTSGDIKINEILNNINITTVSGDIYINSFNINNNSNIKTTSGDILIKDNKSNCYIDTKTTSGDIHINKNNRKSDIVLQIKTTSGDIFVK